MNTAPLVGFGMFVVGAGVGCGAVAVVDVADVAVVAVVAVVVGVEVPGWFLFPLSHAAVRAPPAAMAAIVAQPATAWANRGDLMGVSSLSTGLPGRPWAGHYSHGCTGVASFADLVTGENGAHEEFASELGQQHAERSLNISAKVGRGV